MLKYEHNFYTARLDKGIKRLNSFTGLTPRANSVENNLVVRATAAAAATRDKCDRNIRDGITQRKMSIASCRFDSLSYFLFLRSSFCYTKVIGVKLYLLLTI